MNSDAKLKIGSWWIYSSLTWMNKAGLMLVSISINPPRQSLFVSGPQIKGGINILVKGRHHSVWYAREALSSLLFFPPADSFSLSWSNCITSRSRLCSKLTLWRERCQRLLSHKQYHHIQAWYHSCRSHFDNHEDKALLWKIELGCSAPLLSFLESLGSSNSQLPW